MAVERNWLQDELQFAEFVYEEDKKETQAMSSPEGQVFTSEVVNVSSEPLFADDVEAKKHAEKLGQEYFIEPVVTAA